jgi:hypothetical protein
VTPNMTLLEASLVSPNMTLLELKLQLTSQASYTKPWAEKTTKLRRSSRSSLDPQPSRKSSQNSVASEPPRRRSAVRRTKPNKEASLVTADTHLEQHLRLTSRASDSKPWPEKTRKSSQTSVASEPPRRPRSAVRCTKSNQDASWITPDTTTLEQHLQLTSRASDSKPCTEKTRKSSQNSVASEPPRRRSTVRRTKSNQDSSWITPDMTLEQHLQFTSRASVDSKPSAEKTRKSSQHSVASKAQCNRTRSAKSSSSGSIGRESRRPSSSIRSNIPLSKKAEESLEEEEERLEQQLRLAAGGRYLAAPPSPSTESMGRRPLSPCRGRRSCSPSSSMNFPVGSKALNIEQGLTCLDTATHYY